MGVYQRLPCRLLVTSAFTARRAASWPRGEFMAAGCPTDQPEQPPGCKARRPQRSGAVWAPVTSLLLLCAPSPGCLRVSWELRTPLNTLPTDL